MLFRSANSADLPRKRNFCMKRPRRAWPPNWLGASSGAGPQSPRWNSRKGDPPNGNAGIWIDNDTTGAIAGARAWIEPMPGLVAVPHEATHQALLRYGDGLCSDQHNRRMK